MSTDAIVLLKNDHKEIRRLFREFEQAGDDAAKTKGRLVNRIIELLTIHTYIENEVMYPRVRALLPDLEDDVLESYEEHHVADVLVMELYGMAPEAERFDAKTTVLIENVRTTSTRKRRSGSRRCAKAWAARPSRRSARRWRRPARRHRGSRRSRAR